MVSTSMQLPGTILYYKMDISNVALEYSHHNDTESDIRVL